MKALIIEDNPRLSERIKRQLQKWYIVEVAHSGAEAIQFAAHHSFDIILLDLGLPDMPGLEVCRHLRGLSSSIPILVVSGIDTTASHVELLDAGADDYITKPFHTEELRARMNAALRRRARNDIQEVLTIGDLVIQPWRREVYRAGKRVNLRRKEFDILEYLVLNQGRVMSRSMIISHAWPAINDTAVGSVDVHIKQLRDKVDKPFSYPLIKTSYGNGYMIELPTRNARQKG
jgi:DNA-binding response OmpR family regulator